MAVAARNVARALKMAAIQGMVIVLAVARPVLPVPVVPAAPGAGAARLAALATTSGVSPATTVAKGRAAHGGVIRGPAPGTADGVPRTGRRTAAVVGTAARTRRVSRRQLRTTLTPCMTAVAPLIGIGLLPDEEGLTRRRPRDGKPAVGTGPPASAALAAPRSRVKAA